MKYFTQAVVAAIIVGFWLTTSQFASAGAPETEPTSSSQQKVSLAAKSKRGSGGRKAAQVDTPRDTPKTAWPKRKEAEAEYAKARAVLRAKAAATLNTCNTTAVLYCPTIPALVIPAAPKLPALKEKPGKAPPPIPGAVVAYSALAELTLNAPKPIIGPSPSINPWKIAAVGYPLWLSVDGNTNPAPVTATALDLEVSLDARLTKVVFDMGDQHRVTCTNVTRAWHRGIEPGAPSPACGYTYQQPSLPKGKYTVTARTYWAIDWHTPDEAGTLNIIQAATTTVPVGELQVLIR